ncbi:GAF domain-containing protein [Sphingomonas sp. PB4P5]|uniref:GAF domain-containing protein n=1 Tax=Parasphingomonas puruogangriensis TaxID=3096155 RepID=UPI002FC7EAA4
MARTESIDDIVFPKFVSADAAKIWLSKHFAREADPLRIQSISAEALGIFLGAAWVSYGEIEPGTGAVSTALDWTRLHGVSLDGRHPFDSESHMAREYRLGRTVVVSDACEQATERDAALSTATPLRSFIGVPLIDDGELVASLMVGDDKVRRWSAEEVTLVAQTGARIWSALRHLRLTARLRESEEQFRTLAENMPGLCWVGDHDGVAQWANLRWHAMFDGTGAERGDLTGVCHPADLFLVRETWAAMRARGETAELRLRMRGMDGAYRPFLGKISPVRDSLGAVVRWCGTLLDLSEAESHDRRSTILRAFHDRTRDLTDPHQILTELAQILRDQLGISHLLYGETDDGEGGRPALFHAAGGQASELARDPLLDRAFAHMANAKRHRTVVIDDNSKLDRAADDPVRLSAAKLGVRAAISVPIIKNGKLAGGLSVLNDTSRRWLRNEIELCEELADRVWATLARARAETALQERERNQAFLIEWSDAVRGEASPDAIMSVTLERLGRHLGVARATYSESDDSGRLFSVLGEWRNGVVSLAGTAFSLDDIGATVEQEWVAGEIVRYDDVISDARIEPAALPGYCSAEILAFVSVPLTENGMVRSAMSVQHDRPRRWRDSEIQVIRDVAERTWVALARARAQAAVQVRERDQAFLIAWTDSIRSETDARTILSETLAQLGAHLGVSRANYAEVTPDGTALCVLQEWTEGVVRVIGRAFPLAALGDRVIADHLIGHPFKVSDVATDDRFDESNRPLYDSVGVVAALTVPMLRGGALVAVLSLQQALPRVWTDAEAELVREVADRTLAVLERALSEERLAENEAQLAAFMANAPLAMHLKDAEGRYIRANPEVARAIGRPLDQLVGKHPDELFPPDIAQIVNDLERRALAGQVASVEADLDPSFERRYGSILSIVFLIPGNGGITRTAGFTIDQTERKRAEAQLAQSRDALYQAEKLSALGSLLAGVSHELNNPLSIVVAQAVMMERQAAGGALAERAQKIRRAADRCARIVQTFLGMARQKRPEHAPIDLNAVTSAAHELADYGLRTDGIVTVRDFATSLPPILADADQLHQIIINLIVNAQQAMADANMTDCTLTLATALGPKPGTVVLDVRDTGPGIPAHIRRRIFEPFFTTKAHGQGTGVGLSFSQGLAEAHGGRLEVMHAERGAWFRLTLPINAQAALHVVPALQPAIVARRRHALVIDDEAEIAESLADFLSFEGFECVVAVGGAAARALLEQHSYDLVISDLRMPGLDGPALFAWIADARPDLIDTVAFATGDTLGVSAGRFVSEAQRPVLEKPFTPEAVRRLLERMDLA